MSKFIGRLVNLGVGKEAVRGGGGAPSYWLPKAVEAIKDVATKARSKQNYGTIDGEGNQAPVVLKHGEGPIEFDIGSNSFGLFLLNLLGTVSTADQGDSTYKHTFSLQNDSQHDSLVLCLKDPDRDIMHKLAMVNNLTITIVPDDVVKVTCDVICKNSDGTSQTATYVAENKFLGRHLSLKIASLTGNLAGATAIKPKRVTLNINQNVLRDDNAGTVQPMDIINQMVNISGEIELNHENDTYRDYMLNGDYKALRINLISHEVIGSGSETPEFLIDLSRVDFEGWEPVRPNDEVAKQTINFMGLFDITNGNVVNDCYLINTATSY